jgi:hypothetical protein
MLDFNRKSSDHIESPSSLFVGESFSGDLRFRFLESQTGEKGTLDKKVGGSKKAFGEQFTYDTINHYFHPKLKRPPIS